MTIQVVALIFITIGLPIGWLIAEFRTNSLARRIIGACTIIWSFGVAALYGMLENLNANAYFTAASKQLLSESVHHLQVGHEKAVIREWLLANEQFGITYESNGRYAEIVDQAVKGMSK